MALRLDVPMQTLVSVLTNLTSLRLEHTRWTQVIGF